MGFGHIVKCHRIKSNINNFVLFVPIWCNFKTELTKKKKRWNREIEKPSIWFFLSSCVRYRINSISHFVFALKNFKYCL